MAKPVNVCIVVNTYPPQDISGVGELARELHHALPGLGYRTTVLTRGKTSVHEHGVSRINVRKFFFPPLAPLLFFRRLVKTRFDIIHLNESDGFAVGVLMRALRMLGLSKAKIIVTFQVSYIREFQAVRRLRMNGKVLARPALSELVFKWMRCPIHILCGRITAIIADGIIVASQRTRREIIADYKVAPEKVVVVYNGVHDIRKGERDAGAGRSVPPDRVVFVYVGRFRIRKGVQYLIEAMERASKECGQIHLILVGTGEHERGLRAMIAAKGLSDAVSFTGKLSRKEVFSLFGRCDVYVMPSVYEGFPMAILEAMSCGLPVCASDVSGIPEAVRHGETGFLHSRGDVKQLAEDMATLALDGALRKRMGEEGRKVALEDFSREKVALLHAQAYADLIEAGGAVLD